MQVKVTVNNYKGWFLGSCSVIVVHRVTAMYRAIIYRFDCNSLGKQQQELSAHR